MKKKLLLFILPVLFFTVTIQAQITSAQTGLWADTSTWVGDVVPTSSDNVVIASGHTVTVGTAITRNGNLTVNGALTANAQITIGTAATFEIVNGATYTHSNTGSFISLFAGTENFGPSSNFIVAGALTPGTGPTTSATTGVQGGFGNFTFSATATTLQSNDLFPNVAGNLTINGTSEFRMAGSVAGNGGFTVGGDYTLSSGIFSFGNGSVAPNLTVKGNFVMTGGTLQHAVTGGVSGSEKTCSLIFNKAGVQSFAKSGGTITANLSSWRRINFVVSNGTTLDMGTNILNCAGSSQVDFTVNSGATVRFGDPGGIVVQGTSATTGNIQTSATSIRSFSIGANYEYTGSVAQVTGDGLPSTVNNLTLNNANGLTMSSATTVSNAVTVLDGKLNLGTFDHSTNKLYLGGLGVLNGIYGSTGSTLATVIRDDYFSSATGSLNVSTSTLGVGKNEITGFAVYPNPVSGGKVFINSANSYAERSVSIFDVLGKQVVSQKGTQNSIDVNHLNKGVYIIKVEEEGKVATRKLVIE